MKLQSYIPFLVGSGYFTFTTLFSANGASTGHLSGVSSHENRRPAEHQRYFDRDWGLSYFNYAGIYDSDYSYTPTSEQQIKAQQQVDAYFLALKKGRRHAAKHRYISVETLKPTKKQLRDYTIKMPATRRVDPAELRCVMVFDTQMKQFVGSGCYIVNGGVPTGEIRQFETVSAEFVGQLTL
jgi:hypothetical protein